MVDWWCLHMFTQSNQLSVASRIRLQISTTQWRHLTVAPIHLDRRDTDTERRDSGVWVAPRVSDGHELRKAIQRPKTWRNTLVVTSALLLVTKKLLELELKAEGTNDSGETAQVRRSKNDIELPLNLVWWINWCGFVWFCLSARIWRELRWAEGA